MFSVESKLKTDSEEQYTPFLKGGQFICGLEKELLEHEAKWLNDIFRGKKDFKVFYYEKVIQND